MGVIITVANQKGGVGKTTTAINMSAALAEKGKKILLVDIDSQGNTTSGLGIEKNELESTTYELLIGETSTDDCLIHTDYKNLDVLPSNVDMAAAEIELLDEENREFKLRHILRPLKKNYDFIVVDCPPSLNILTVNAMVAADSILVPVQCEYYALEGLSQLLYTIELVKERLNPELKIEGLLFTMYDARVRLSGQVVQNVKANLNEKIFKTTIPRNVRLAEAPSHGKPISAYSRFSSGARAYKNFAKELINLHANDPKEEDEKEAETVEKDVYTDDILGLEENAKSGDENAKEKSVENEENKASKTINEEKSPEVSDKEVEEKQKETGKDNDKDSIEVKADDDSEVKEKSVTETEKTPIKDEKKSDSEMKESNSQEEKESSTEEKETSNQEKTDDPELQEEKADCDKTKVNESVEESAAQEKEAETSEIKESKSKAEKAENSETKEESEKDNSEDDADSNANENSEEAKNAGDKTEASDAEDDADNEEDANNTDAGLNKKEADSEKHNSSDDEEKTAETSEKEKKNASAAEEKTDVNNSKKGSRKSRKKK